MNTVLELGILLFTSGALLGGALVVWWYDYTLKRDLTRDGFVRLSAKYRIKGVLQERVLEQGHVTWITHVPDADKSLQEVGSTALWKR